MKKKENNQLKIHSIQYLLLLGYKLEFFNIPTLFGGSCLNLVSQVEETVPPAIFYSKSLLNY